MCSDNHNIKEYSVKEKMWIKADPTFEGLKQILYEPDEPDPTDPTNPTDPSDPGTDIPTEPTEPTGPIISPWD